MIRLLLHVLALGRPHAFRAISSHNHYLGYVSIQLYCPKSLVAIIYIVFTKNHFEMIVRLHSLEYFSISKIYTDKKSAILDFFL